MVIVDNILISDDILNEQFVCDLEKCKGGCCVDGDAGAPLEKSELKWIKKAFKLLKPELSKEAIDVIEKEGAYVHEEGFGYVTPVINGGICVYGYTDESGIVKCLIEKAYNEGRIPFKKPISCHLYPIREVKKPNYLALNYEPREVLCAPACRLGKKLGVKVYAFLKEPLIRRFGDEFYHALETIDKEKMQ
ncbi:MAG TPA: DUF3109 family protein [Chitinophagaceae bacterium]|nr:MAG: hypothetical protein UZ11_BCD004000735 [Bacteroidetes bacterium OLB11]HMN32568.1 DUF3109 family protein [Chitinophagaceae bacterium]